MYDLKFTDIGEGLHEAEILQWYVRIGDKVKIDQPILEVQTDKAAVEITSPKSGTIKEIGGEEGDTIHVGDTLIKLELNSTETETKAVGINEVQEESTPTISKPEQRPSKRVLAAPSVRKLARDMGIELSKVKGTAKNGRITKEDVLAFSKRLEDDYKSSSDFEATAANTMEINNRVKVDERIPIRGLRRKISENMVKSAYTIPHVTAMEEIHADELIKLRSRLNDVSTEKLTFLPFLVKVVIEALKRHAIFNAAIDEESQSILLKKEYHIGIATATSKGLIVPVIHHADQKSVEEIAKEIAVLSKKAEDGTLSLKEISGGTFTISSTGANGGLFATPIINYPQSAILGVHAIKEKPVILPSREIGIGHVMGVSLSFDHRIIDGEPAGLFMNKIKSLIENPERLFLSLR